MTQVKKAAKSLEPQVSKTDEEKEADEALNPSHNEAEDAESFSDQTPISFAQKHTVKSSRKKSKSLA